MRTLPHGKRLAVPPMHTDIPRTDRIMVFELILRGQIGLAWDLAVDLEETRLKKLRKNSSARIVSMVPGGRRLGAQGTHFIGENDLLECMAA